MTPLPRIGILAYGSLVSDPGAELEPLIESRIPVETPFGVEYGRRSKTRGGAPTVVRHPQGGPVAACLLVLRPDVELEAACHMLWRRECRREGTGARPSEKTQVLVEQIQDFHGCDVALYTNFTSDPITNLSPEKLASFAIESIHEAESGMDGISYLADLIEQGIITPLTYAYRDEILRRTGCATLGEALEAVRSGRGGG